MTKLNDIVGITVTKSTPDKDGRSVQDAILNPPSNPYTDNGEYLMKSKLEREGFKDVSVTISEPTVTITKAQLRKLVEAAVHDIGYYCGVSQCALCRSLLDEDDHTPDCELEELRRLSE